MTAQALETEAIVLRRSVFKESSLICDVLTPEWGVIPVIAHGVRKEKSPLVGLCEPLDLVRYELAESRSRYRTLTGGNLLRHLPRDLSYETLECLSAVAELTVLLQAPDGEWEDLFQSVRGVLHESCEPDPARRLFRWIHGLFPLLGCQPEWSVCRLCGQPVGLPAAYDPGSGSLICRNHPGLLPGTLSLSTPEAVELAALTGSGNPPRSCVDTNTRSTVVGILLTHLALQFHIPFTLKSIRSRDLIHG